MEHTNQELESLADDIAIEIIRKYFIANDSLAMAKYKNNLAKLILSYLIKLK